MGANNPGCFDDPDKTFADLYMKSGLYITEIVKRLYRSEKMKMLIPDDKARIRHILDKQVYGMAPTRIIYLIATNYILGFDEALKGTATHFVQADAAEASKTGTLAAVVEREFGK
ncbi:MAG: type II restriction endonuclease [Ruminococcaceae bacterium]|nr:type II restriction endonuclease [Oscillospiraceae bacterium]